jgi:hypothetical protein
VSGVIIASAMTALVGIGILASEPLTIYGYFTFAIKPRELPTRLIRPCFRRITKRELPGKMDSPKALFQGGVDPGIFVKFQTDSQGIEFVCNAFDTAQTGPKLVDPNWIRDMTQSGGHIFYIPFEWEQRIGVQLFDQEAIESGRMIEYLGPPGTGGYKVFIDDHTATVYIHAFCL